MKRVLISSAIPSVNGVKHLGNLVGSMLPADIFARFCRARGYETMAVCATDEHGAPIELAALEEGVPVARLLRQMARGPARSGRPLRAFLGQFRALVVVRRTAN